MMHHWTARLRSSRCRDPFFQKESKRRCSFADLADLSYFLEIAKHRNFRRAGLDLGISASALSHALRGLEERLGVRLLNRTSRSVTLTAAGEELRAAIMAPFEEIGRAVDILNRFRDAPVGRIGSASPRRLRISSSAQSCPPSSSGILTLRSKSPSATA